MKRQANPVDQHVGRRVRMRRVMLGFSQEKLGDALGLTFQQVQKYEKGINRMGASRLQQIAAALAVPVSFFFEGASDHESAPTQQPPGPLAGVDVLVTSETIQLHRAFGRIRCPKIRRRVVELVSTLGEEAGEETESAPGRKALRFV